MKLTIKHYNSGCGNHTTIVEEPYASALKNIDGLDRSSDSSSYRGVRFGRRQQNALVIYFKPYSLPGWDAVQAAGSGTMDIPDEMLSRIMAASAAIDAVIASAVVRPTYVCAAAADGCRARVSTPGGYCPSCAHDQE